MVVWHLICIGLWFIWTFVEGMVADWDGTVFRPKTWSLRFTFYVAITSLVGLYLIVKFGFIQNEWLFAEIK